jgi:hypothetical protein
MECIWYVSGFRRPWEAAVIGNLAAALKTGDEFFPRVYAEGGTANFRVEGILSWGSLTFFERAVLVLFRGRLWHLWGDAPSWWGWVRLRARTVHTSLDVRPRWRGHPTRLFAEQAREGESRIVPTFEVKVAWTDDKEDASTSFLLAAQPEEALKDAMNEVLPKWGVEGVFLNMPRSGLGSESESEPGFFQPELLKKTQALFIDDTPSNALLAAYLTMRGVPVVIRRVDKDNPLLRAVLGPGGYLTPGGESKEDWKATLDEAMSEKGRSASAAARRFLKENYAASGASESLMELYRSVTASSFASPVGKGKS